MNLVGTKNEQTRTAWLEAALKEIPVGARLLDAGAGERQYERFCQHLIYVAQDFAAYDGKGDGAGLQTGAWDQSRLDIVSDISAIPEPDASFDAVMCVEVFEHLPNPVLALKEFERLVRSGGQLIITAPFCSLTHFAPYHFATGFNRYYYETHLPAHGFRILDLEPNGNYFEYLAQEIRRLPQVAAQFAKHDALRLPERLAIRTMLSMLNRLTKNDSGSAELLHHGYHVRAVKE